MKFKFISQIFTVLALSTVLLSSCSAPQKVVYLEDAETIPNEVLNAAQRVSEPDIMPGDLLNIMVTAVDMTSVAPFNRGMYVNEQGVVSNVGSHALTNDNLEISTDYYLVNPSGNIDFPVIGEIHVAGLNKQEVSTMIRDEIYPKYLKEAPNVTVRLMNFRVTVTGAVRNPGIYQSRNERMNFLEALALAGDLDIKGEREGVLLYRTNADGSHEVHRINLRDKNLLLSPYFNLQQNDIIYVVPNKSMRANAWALNPSVGATITIVGGISSLASLIIGVVNLAK